MMTDDMELVREYARNHSEEAFATLVSRYINLVYSVALRQLHDTHLAEESTQAAFVILARKAGSLGPKTIVSAWLCRTAHYVAADTLRSQRRRQNREQEVHMQSLLDQSENESSSWPDIAPLLDGAMARLNERDHCAIVLRFFEGKDLKQVGAALGVSENTAKTRVSRAVEKLRKSFVKRGITLTAAVIAGAISANSIQAAPAALAKSVTAAAISKSAAAGSTLLLAKIALITMKTKTVVITAVAVVAILAVGSYLALHKNRRPVVITSNETTFVKISNDAFTPLTANIYFKKRDPRFVVDTDRKNKRTPSSLASSHIKSLVNPKQQGSGDYIASTHTPSLLLASSIVKCFVNKSSPLFGKRIRVTGWIKANDVRNWAGATLNVFNTNGMSCVHDDMSSRPIQGTVDWQQVEFITDLPEEPCAIYFMPSLYGTGEMWCDDVQIELAPADAPITDDRIWRINSTNPVDYSETEDSVNTRDGHPTLCLAYLPAGKGSAGSWMNWGHNIPSEEMDKYRGHTLRMTFWTKTEGVGSFQARLLPRDATSKSLSTISDTENPPIHETTDWTRYTLKCLIPNEAQTISTGFNLLRSGKAWIDTNSLKYEIVD